MKAKFIRKYYGTGFDRNMVYMDYEYRGHEYTVFENRAKGSEPLAWQHRNEQNRIDTILDAPKQTGGSPADLDEIWKMLGWD